MWRLSRERKSTSPLQTRDREGKSTSPLQTRDREGKSTTPLQARDREGKSTSPLQAKDRKGKSTSPLQARDSLTLVLGYGFFSLLKTVTIVKCRTAIKALSLYLNLCNVEQSLVCFTKYYKLKCTCVQRRR